MSTQNLLPAGRSKYDGPKNHRAIIRQIHKDCKQGMSYDYINRVVGLFFSTKGIVKFMKQGETFKVPPLGSFILTKRGKRKRMKEAQKLKERKRLSHNKKMRKYERRIRAEQAFAKVNKNRADAGWEPLDFDTFVKISKRKL